MKQVTRQLLLAVLCVVTPFFFFGGPGCHASRSYKAIWDIGHIVYFTLAGIGLAGMLAGRAKERSLGKIFLQVFIVVLLAGSAIELLQSFFVHRSSSYMDLLRDLVGAVLGCSLFFSCWNGFSGWQRRILTGGILLILLPFLWPAVRALLDERVAVSQFPILSDFETRFQLRRWNHIDQLAWVNDPVRHGEHAMRVQLTTKKYSGTRLFYFPSDWSEYSWLNFSVYKKDGEPMELHGRVHDQLHKELGRAYTDRFNTRFFVKNGWNDFRISLRNVQQAPATREMDMHKIEGFAIFVISQPRPRVLYLDNVYLSK